MSASQSELDFGMSEGRTPSGRKSPDGNATTNLVFSAHTGNNADVFPAVLRLHIEEGSKIADVTFGKGVFWRNVDTSKYDLYRFANRMS